LINSQSPTPNNERQRPLPVNAQIESTISTTNTVPDRVITNHFGGVAKNPAAEKYCCIDARIRKCRFIRGDVSACPRQQTVNEGAS